MADDPHNTSDISDHAEPAAVAKEDAETTAARRELKQTSISERTAGGLAQLSQDDKSASEDDGPGERTTARRLTPDVSLGPPKEDALKEHVSSPKKKRAHDELDENRDVTGAPLDEEPADGQSRTDRSEPEKKRPRDRQASASAVQSGKEEVVGTPADPADRSDNNTKQEPLSASASPRSSMEQRPTEAAAPAAKPEPPKQTSATAFASSGFAKLAASTTSPFGSIASGGAKPSLFGSASSGSASPFGSALGGGSKPTTSTTTTAPSAPPKLSFGGATASASPFGALNGQGSGSGGGGSVFKSASSSPFASAFGGRSALLSGGARLSNFGKPGEALKSGKPARPFGAPDSDAEGDKGDEESDGEEGGGGEAEEEEEESKGEEGGDDKRKIKLQKIVVDDGEGQELTLFSVRAKMYVMEKGVGWKERGAGMLKVNVPKSTVELDEQGAVDPASFDPSVLEEDDEEDEKEDAARRKHVRLIMRQDHTLRVILNTVILPAMKFQVTNRLKTSTVLFTAFEGGEVRQVQMKLSEANATAFSQLVEMLKRRLADV